MVTVVALIHGSQGAFGISYPDFPGATSLGDNLDDVLSRGREGLASHVDAMVGAEFDMPGIRSLDELKADPSLAEDFEEALAVALIDLELPGRSVRLSISMDERLIERIDRRARAAGETRSGFLAAAARQRLALPEAN